MTTPCLVSAVSQLTRNLIIQAPQDTVTALKNESLIPFFVRWVPNCAWFRNCMNMVRAGLEKYLNLVPPFKHIHYTVLLYNEM